MATESVMAITAPFAVEYTKRSASPTHAAIEAMLMITPRPLARKAGIAAAMHWYTPLTLIDITLSKSASGVVSALPICATPALFTKISN